MYHVRYIIFALVLFSCNVFAAEDADVRIFINGQDADKMLFDAQLGTRSNAIIQIDNVGDAIEKYVIFVVDTEGHEAMSDENAKSLVNRTRFFDDALATEEKDILSQNDYDVVQYCIKNTDVSTSWCKGVSQLETTVLAKESVKIPFIIDIAQGEVDHEAAIVIAQAGNKEVVIKKIDIAYRVPDKNITQLDIRGFHLEKIINYSGIDRLIHSGSKNTYQSFLKVENSGTEKAQYKYKTSVESLWIGEVMDFSGEGAIAPGQIDENKMTVTLPRGGKVRIVSNIAYTNQEGKEVNTSSSPITMYVWPVQILTVFLVGICFCVICVLLYKYVNKNMFNFRNKKKEEEQKFVGTYIVQDADNIISIAQKYGIAWKDLAANNDIDAPYILVSGETIRVPIEKQDSFDGGHIDIKELTPSADHVEKKYDEQKEHIIGVDQKTRTNFVMPMTVQNASLTQETPKPIVDISKEIKQEVITKKPEQAHANKKIMYASQESTLMQPSAEPTTRAIDIEWMRDDEAAYIEEMELQEKKLNIRIVSIAIVALCAVSAGIWFGTTKFIEYKKSKSVVSVEKLIKETPDETQQISQNEQVSENNIQEDVQEQKAGEEGAAISQDTAENIEPKDIAIQVLNAGSETGAAGTVSGIFKEKNYNMKLPQNAKNDYVGVVIYYKENKEYADTLLAMIPEKYSNKKIEESSDITNTYQVDYVIVLGK